MHRANKIYTQNFSWKIKGKRSIMKPRHRWENTKMDLGEIVWEYVKLD